MANHIFMGISLDGYVADKNNSVEWLNAYPQEQGPKSHFSLFMESMDAIIMGRATFEMVHSFGVWPYTKPVVVLSKSLTSLPPEYEGKASLCADDIKDVLLNTFRKGYKELYIDGGAVVRSFLAMDFIDSMTLTQVPVLLGGGVSLFGELAEPLKFTHVHTEVLDGGLVMSGYMRKR